MLNTIKGKIELRMGDGKEEGSGSVQMVDMVRMSGAGHSGLWASEEVESPAPGSQTPDPILQC